MLPRLHSVKSSALEDVQQRNSTGRPVDSSGRPVDSSGHPIEILLDVQ